MDRHLARSEEHTSELQSRGQLVCRLLLEKKKPLCFPRTMRRSDPTSSAANGSIAGGSWNWPATAPLSRLFFFFNDTATTEIYTLSLHDALPICWQRSPFRPSPCRCSGR